MYPKFAFISHFVFFLLFGDLFSVTSTSSSSSSSEDSKQKELEKIKKACKKLVAMSKHMIKKKKLDSVDTLKELCGPLTQATDELRRGNPASPKYKLSKQKVRLLEKCHRRLYEDMLKVEMP
jgi:hypothetical protein